jgi:peptidoglycan/LPS O-acetylase OafA/YrhL
MVNPGRRKLVELEALRGIAAMIVFFHHFLLLIAPRLHGRNFPDDPIALVRTPLFALVNGSAAVAVFFVLSGFVLTVGAMEDRDWRQFLIGVLKRWPRLALLVVVVNIASAIFFMLGLYRDSMWFNLTTMLLPIRSSTLHLSSEALWPKVCSGHLSMGRLTSTRHYGRCTTNYSAALPLM